MQVKVFVIDVEGRPCLPTRAARARRLLRDGKANVIQVMPFTIQLRRAVEKPVGSFTCSLDDGAKHVGVAIVNEHTMEVVFLGQIDLRQDVSKKILQRAQYRRTRRARKLRYRAIRFNNRKQMTPAPSVRQRKDSIVRWVIDMMKRVNIGKTIVEEGIFDTTPLVAGRLLSNKEFFQHEYESKSFRAKVLYRDRFQCQRCNSVDMLEAHHIKQKKDGGSSRAENGITLCKKCHKELHTGLWGLSFSPKSFKYSAWLMVGKTYLREQLKNLGLSVNVVYGWMTASWRKQIGLEKSHSNDAILMICVCCVPKISSMNWLIKPRRSKIWENNPTKTCIEKNGFRHFDIVESHNRSRGKIIGSIRSLKAKSITLRTSFDDNFAVSYNKTRLLQRPNGLVYLAG